MTASMVEGRDVVEVGAYDVNGSVRPHIESLGPASYLGLDIEEGPGVDRVLDARDLLAELGRGSADVVISTEMIEHVRDWPVVVRNLKGLLRPGGHLLVTTDRPASRITPGRTTSGDMSSTTSGASSATSKSSRSNPTPPRQGSSCSRDARTPTWKLPRRSPFESICDGSPPSGSTTDAETAEFRPPAPSPIPASRSASAALGPASRARRARSGRLHLGRRFRPRIIAAAALRCASRRRPASRQARVRRI